MSVLDQFDHALAAPDVALDHACHAPNARLILDLVTNARPEHELLHRLNTVIRAIGGVVVDPAGVDGFNLDLRLLGFHFGLLTRSK
jgi:hypothetical protein